MCRPVLPRLLRADCYYSAPGSAIRKAINAEARRCGQKAAELAMAGDLDGSVAIKRLPGPTYRVKYVRAELSRVARDTRPMPRTFINKAGNHVTAAFRKYALPLVGRLPPTAKLA